MLGQFGCGAAVAGLGKALGTALPESAITFVVFGANAAQKSLGVGAALGGLLVLPTMALGVVGVTLLLVRKHLPHGAAARVQFAYLSCDQG